MNLNLKQEVFCKIYSKTTSKVMAAYMAGYCDNIKERVKLEDLTQKQFVNLKKAAGLILTKPEIIAEIRRISDKEAEKLGEAGLNEILSYLSLIMRRSRENLNNLKLMSRSLKACELLLRRYPEYKEGIEEQIFFNRGTKEELN